MGLTGPVTWIQGDLFSPPDLLGLFQRRHPNFQQAILQAYHHG
jgi:hypothetical protein